MYSMMKRLKVTDLPIYYQQLLDLVSYSPDRKDFTSELKKLFSEVFNYLEIISIDKNRLEKGERFFDSVDSLYDQDLDAWGYDKSKEGHVYVIKDIRSGLYKIGITKNMEKRMKQLGVGDTAELIDDIFVADAREREKQLHKKYKDARLPQTEYFNIGYPPSLDL